MKAWLSQEGVSFVDRNVEEDHEAYDELLARGLRTVPVTIIGDTAIKGFDETALRRALSSRNTRGPQR